MEKLDRRDLRFLGACLLAIAAGALVAGSLFKKAFPEASIEFRVNRGEARVVAERFLAGQGYSTAGAHFAGEFDVDETAKVYLERELGLEKAGAIYGRAAKVWQWRMRWFRSGVKEEQLVAVSPLGELIGFRSVLKEDAPGARLTEEQARAKALAFLATRGLSASALTPVEATPVARPHRSDWKFVDEKKDVRFAGATVRFETTVSGDRITAWSEFVHVPEQWERDYQKLRSKNEAAGEVATAGLFLTILAMLAVLVRKIVLKDVRWGLVAAFGGIAFVLALLSSWNELPLTLFHYDTASPLSAYMTNQILLGVLAAIATAAGIALVVAAAEPIYRERFPRQLSLAGAFSARGIQSKALLPKRRPRLCAGRLLHGVPGGLLRRCRALRRLGPRGRAVQRHAEHVVSLGDRALHRVPSGGHRGGDQPDVLDLVSRPPRRGARSSPSSSPRSSGDSATRPIRTSRSSSAASRSAARAS